MDDTWVDELAQKHTSKRYTKYKKRHNAVCTVVYHPEGEPLPLEVRHQIEDAVTKIAKDNRLLVSVTLT
jgi:hypothetical protein